MKTRHICRIIQPLVAFMLALFLICPVHAATSGTYDPTEGVSVSVSGATSTTATTDESTITVTAKGSGGLWGAGAYSKSATIVIENTSTSRATISCNINKTTVYKFEKADGTEGTLTDTSYSVDLDAGGKATLTLTTNTNSTTNTVVLSGFSYKAAAASSTVKILFDSSFGSVTANNSSAESGAEYTVSASDGLSLVVNPNPNSDVTFLGWRNENDYSKATLTDGKYMPTEDITLRAMFASPSSKAWFLVNGGYWYDDLNAAANAAGSGGTVVLAADGTLHALVDDASTTNADESLYSIPSGVTLLIPRDAAHTVQNTAPHTKQYVDFNDVPTITAYRTLTMASGAKIVVNGSLCVAGVQMYPGAYSSSAGHKTDTDAGFIKMNANSTITINSNANLYAWGFITGSGSVVVNSGANVYELFQIANWIGGDLADKILGDTTRGVFPISQYYMQNVEVPMTMYAGAKEYGYFSIGFTNFDLSGVGISHETEIINFIGSSGSLFNMTNGYIIKDYLEGEDRLDIQIYGDASVDALDLTVQLTMTGGNVEIDSSTRELPINHNMTVQILSGTTTINQDLAMLPSSKLVIGTNGTCVLGSGVSLYLYDADQKELPLEATDGDSGYGKGTVLGYCGVYDDYPHLPVPCAPGRTLTRTDAVLRAGEYLTDATIVVNGILDASAGNLYRTAGGACISSEGGGQVITKAGTQTVTYQALHYYKSSDHALSYSSVAIQPVLLHNGDGSYDEIGNYENATTVDTSVASSVATTFNYVDGYWRCATHTWNDGVVTTQPSCITEGIKTFTCTTCNDTYTEAIPAQGHDWSEDGICNRCDLFKIYASSLRAGDTLDMFFYLRNTHLTGLDTTAEGYNYQAVIVRSRAGKEDTSEIIPANEWEAFGTDLYRFCYDGIAAKEMTDNVVVTIQKNVNGVWTDVSVSATESVEGYALRYLGTLTNVEENSKDGALRKMLVDMLKYGAASQTLFSYNTDDLADPGTHSAYATSPNVTPTENAEPDTTYCHGSTLKLESSLIYNLYFTDAAVGKTFSITYDDHYGTPHHKTVTVTAAHKNGDYYIVPVSGLAIADGRQKISCQLIDGENVTVVFTGDIQDYLARALLLDTTDTETVNLQAVAKMLMNFIDSAHNYFHFVESSEA